MLKALVVNILQLKSLKLVKLCSTKRFLNQYRTRYCNELSLKDIDKEVQICGWLKAIRFNKFLLIRDFYDPIQVFIPDSMVETIKFNELNLESVIKVVGVVRARPRGRENMHQNNGKIEIECKSLEILNSCSPNIPFQISELNNQVNEQLRLKYRYLDLRFDNMKKNLITRSNFVTAVRKFFDENKFLDIETPTLFRRTPGGAREFIVPTKYEKKFYCLTQSPQQFKQLLMCAGFDKYYQIARCYRDEELKSDRQPEFTQIDIEMSFINELNCIELIESLFDKCWPFKNNFKIPFRKLTYDDAIKGYGIDKPDLRFDMKFIGLSEFFKNNQKSGIQKIDVISSNLSAYAFKIPFNLCSNSEDTLKFEKIEKIFRNCFTQEKKDLIKYFTFLIVDSSLNTNHIGKHLNKDFQRNLNANLGLTKDEMAVILIGENKRESYLLEVFGKLRLSLADHIDASNSINNCKISKLRDPNKFEFLWVVDFPLFTYNEEEKKYESTHHPFTAPKEEYIEELLQNKCDLSIVKGQHYDLVLNGNEIAGGSIRIHNAKLQRFILKEILKEDTSPLEHLIEALEYGAPPHGGIAIGLDRLISIICKSESIRDVIAFPKSSNGRDLMSDAPSILPQSELDYYKITLNK